jgi:hypothetical protein
LILPYLTAGMMKKIQGCRRTTLNIRMDPFSLFSVVPPRPNLRAIHEIDHCQIGIEHARVLARVRKRAHLFIQLQRVLPCQFLRRTQTELFEISLHRRPYIRNILELLYVCSARCFHVPMLSEDTLYKCAGSLGRGWNYFRNPAELTIPISTPNAIGIKVANKPIPAHLPERRT